MFPVEPDISSRHPVAALQDCDELPPPSPIYSPSIEIRRAAYQISIQDFSTLKNKKSEKGAAHLNELDTTPPLRGCRGYAARNRLIFRVSLFTPIVYRLNVLIFWFTNHVHTLSFNGLHVNNSVESGLPCKPHMLPFQLTPSGTSEHIFTSECLCWKAPC